MEVAPLKEEIAKLKKEQTQLPLLEAELESQILAVENAQRSIKTAELHVTQIKVEVE